MAQDDKVTKELTKALRDNTKAVGNLAEELKKSRRKKAVDPAQPAGTEKLKG